MYILVYCEMCELYSYEAENYYKSNHQLSSEISIEIAI